jgi:2-polyprenyl-3-methyl-5-hydroxy-6-metoxy-1,4-benzoquinol methylase
MHPKSGTLDTMDYSDYGDHITSRDSEYFKSRMKLSKLKKVFFAVLKVFAEAKMKILDFGGGAGFFCNSCKESGFSEAYLLEPSLNFREAAIHRVGIDKRRVLSSLSEVTGSDFKLVVMLDVIEHLPIESINSILTDLTNNIENGGYLLGATPNANSFNILLHKSKDPVIAPPSHAFYFTKQSLDMLLKKHGFRKTLCFTSGASTNSFFRKEKHSPSWVESPNGNQKFVARAIKLLFMLLNVPLTILGRGYHIYFLYQYSPVRESEFPDR